MRGGVISAAVLIAAISLWLSQEPATRKEEPQKTPAQTHVDTRRPLPSAPAQEPHADERVLNKDYDYTATWTLIEAEHARREVEERPEPRAQLEGFFSTLDASLRARRDFAAFAYTIEQLDCRKRSCVVRLRFESREQASAFRFMHYDGQFARHFNLSLKSECPLRRTAMPQATSAGSYSSLWHFDCDGSGFVHD